MAINLLSYESLPTLTFLRPAEVNKSFLCKFLTNPKLFGCKK